MDGAGYAIWGRVHYEDVEGAGFLEMWSVFSGDARYFTRTADAEGPLARITGSYDWRPFELPFHLHNAEPPSRLELNLVLPGKGTAWIGPLQLIVLEAAAEGSGWWSGRSGGLIGGVGGSVIGMLGARWGASPRGGEPGASSSA